MIGASSARAVHGAQGEPGDREKARHETHGSGSITDLFDLADIATWKLTDKVVCAHQIELFLADLHFVRSELGRMIYDEWPTDPDGMEDPYLLVAEGVPAMVKETRSKRKQWDTPQIVARLAARYSDEIVDRETGEVPPMGEIVSRAMGEIIECAGMTPSKAWRATALKARGIDPNDVSEWKLGDAPGVRFAP